MKKKNLSNSSKGLTGLANIGQQHSITHSIARIRTRPSSPAVSFEWRKRNHTAKEKKYNIRFISEYYVAIT